MTTAETVEIRSSTPKEAIDLEGTCGIAKQLVEKLGVALDFGRRSGLPLR